YRLKMSKKQIYYSDKYNDEEFEYRHVVLPKQLSKLVPSSHLMTEDEWRGLGVQQSQGWIHYMIHKPGERYKGDVHTASSPRLLLMQCSQDLKEFLTNTEKNNDYSN
ncbi:hypothetical protein L3Q82_025795, partial [Scortum barcoo]